MYPRFSSGHHHPPTIDHRPTDDAPLPSQRSSNVVVVVFGPSFLPLDRPLPAYLSYSNLGQ